MQLDYLYSPLLYVIIGVLEKQMKAKTGHVLESLFERKICFQILKQLKNRLSLILYMIFLFISNKLKCAFSEEILFFYNLCSILKKTYYITLNHP